MLLLIGVWFFIMQQTQGGGNRVMSFGKSRAKLQGEEKQKLPLGMLPVLMKQNRNSVEAASQKSGVQFNDLGVRNP